MLIDDNDMSEERQALTGKPSYYYEIEGYLRRVCRNRHEQTSAELPKDQKRTQAVRRFVNTISDSDREIIIGQSKLPSAERRIRFNWLCWKASIEAGLIFHTIEPPQHAENKGKEEKSHE